MSAIVGIFHAIGSVFVDAVGGLLTSPGSISTSTSIANGAARPSGVDVKLPAIPAEFSLDRLQQMVKQMKAQDVKPVLQAILETQMLSQLFFLTTVRIPDPNQRMGIQRAVWPVIQYISNALMTVVRTYLKGNWDYFASRKVADAENYLALLLGQMQEWLLGKFPRNSAEFQDRMTPFQTSFCASMEHTRAKSHFWSSTQTKTQATALIQECSSRIRNAWVPYVNQIALLASNVYYRGAVVAFQEEANRLRPLLLAMACTLLFVTAEWDKEFAPSCGMVKQGGEKNAAEQHGKHAGCGCSDEVDEEERKRRGGDSFGWSRFLEWEGSNHRQTVRKIPLKSQKGKQYSQRIESSLASKTRSSPRSKTKSKHRHGGVFGYGESPVIQIVNDTNRLYWFRLYRTIKRFGSTSTISIAVDSARAIDAHATLVIPRPDGWKRDLGVSIDRDMLFASNPQDLVDRFNEPMEWFESGGPTNGPVTQNRYRHDRAYVYFGSSSRVRLYMKEWTTHGNLFRPIEPEWVLTGETA